MKLMLVFSLALGICAAADQPAARKPASAQASARPTEIPAGSVETAPGFFDYTDSKGTKWLLRRTPFGVAAVEESKVDLVKTTDEGDRVRFDKTTPFGSRTWERKKSDMDQYERELWERQRDRAAAK